MSNPEYRVGQRFNHWTLLAKLGNHGTGRNMWRVVCDCGTVEERQSQTITGGESKSCGSCGQRRRRERERRRRDGE
jgi:hypothetical protein